MYPIIDLTLLLILLFVSPLPDRVIGALADSALRMNARYGTLVGPALASAAVLGCGAVAAVFHEPVPAVPDEFSYLLASNTLASWRVKTPSPALAEFFETFHVLVRPVYASKYFPGQGIILAVGEVVTGHPIAGVWLSAGCAILASYWMLSAWTTKLCATVASLLLLLQVGIYSYWTQSYWGGFVAVTGGALFFGGLRRLWSAPSMLSASLLALGVVVLASTRPLEGAVVVMPALVMYTGRLICSGQYASFVFWQKVFAPATGIVLGAALATSCYNQTVTGSWFVPPYVLHEAQYQRAPALTDLPLREGMSYSSYWLEYYYSISEVQLYRMQQVDPSATLWRLSTLGRFYFGILLATPLVLLPIARGGVIALLQVCVLVMLATAIVATGEGRAWPGMLTYGCLAIQWAICFHVYSGFWHRVAFAIVGVIASEAFFVKWAFPHYSAPATCLVSFIQVESIRSLFRGSRTGRAWPSVSFIRSVALLLPVFCALSLCARVAYGLYGGRSGPLAIEGFLPLEDWSLHRAAMQRLLSRQDVPQLVFVRYDADHDVNAEWVYNHSDIGASHVLWARDLGTEKNEVLIRMNSGRVVWLLEADRSRPALVPYPGHNSVLNSSPRRAGRSLPW